MANAFAAPAATRTARSRRSARGGSRSRSRSARGPVAAPRSRRWPASCASALGGAVYAEDERPLEEHVFEALRARGWTVAVAESCTAGLVAARLAEVPGISEVLLGGVIAYADEVKRDLLGVPAETLGRARRRLGRDAPRPWRRARGAPPAPTSGWP